MERYKVSAKCRRHKEERNKNFRTEKYSRLKNYLDMLHSKIEMTKQRVSELEHRSIGIIEEKQRETVNRASGTCVTMPEDLTFVSPRSHKERRNSVVQKKIFEEIMIE